MNKLAGKVALIAGGTGGVGEGIVRAFLQAGATVVVPSRTPDKLNRLREYLGESDRDRFISIEGELSNVERAEELRDRIMEEVTQLDAIVASVNGRWNEDIPLLQTSLDDWRRMLESNLTAHFITARTFLPVLQKGSSYTLIGGGAAEQAIPNYGLVCIPAAGQLMLTQILAAESKGTGIRINEVVLHSMIATRERPSDEHPEWLTANEVGQYTAWLATDEASMVSGSIIRLYQH